MSSPLALRVLVSLICAWNVFAQRGFRSNGNLPWSQVSNISEWHHDLWFEDGNNTLGLVDRFVRGSNSFYMSAVYPLRESYNSKYSVVFTDIYFAIDGDACFTADVDWKTLQFRDYPSRPPYFGLWCSTDAVDARPWEFDRFPNTDASDNVAITFSAQDCGDPYTGRVRLSLEYSMNPSMNQFYFGSGSHVTLSNPKVVPGKCADTTHEMIVLLAVVGSFLFILAALAIFLFCSVQKKHKEGKPFVALAAWWHLFNVSAHALFAWSMKTRNFTVPYALTIFFLFAPLLLQLVAACVGMATELRRAEFSVWYYRHRIVCNLLGTVMPLLGMHTLALMHSRLGGFSGFSAPFSPNAIKSIKFSLLLSSFMQDLPQFIVQIVMYQAASATNPIAIVSMITALSTLLYRISIWSRRTYINWGSGQSGILQSSVGASVGDWVELWDSETGRWYYENTRTHVTTWEKPKEFTASTLELSKPTTETLIHAIISRKRIVFSTIAAIIFFGLGMATRFHFQFENNKVASS